MGKPNLRPEIATSWELGVSQRLFNGKTFGSATYFESYVEDLIGLIVTKTDPATGRVIEEQNANIGKVNIKGIEAELEQKIMKSLSAFANFTWQDAKTKENPAIKASEGKQVRFIPEIMYNVGLGFSRGGFDANILTKYVSKVYHRDHNTDKATGVPWGYDPIFVTDLKLSYQVSKATMVSLDVNNLFDWDYYYSYKSPGRNFMGTLTLRF